MRMLLPHELPEPLRNLRKYQGGFKFQVQRVNDGTIAHRLPGAWQNRDTSSGACSTDARWHSTHAGYSSTGPCPWAGTGATTHSYSRWCPVAKGYTDRQRRSGSPAAPPGVRARPSLSLDHRSAFCAVAQAHAGVSW